LATDPAGGAYSTPPGSPAGFKGVPLLREGREQRGGEGKEKGEEEKEGMPP